MKIDIEEQLNRAELDPFLEGVPGATFFHAPAWMESLCSSFARLQPVWITAREDGRLQGLMPLCVSRRGPVHSLAAMPFGTYGTPLSTDPAVKSAVLSRYIGMASAPSCAASSASLFGMEESGVPAPPGRIRMEECRVIGLAGGFESYRSGALSAKKRQICNRCEREGIVVKILSSSAEFDDFYEVYSRGSVRWGGVHPYPKAFLAGLFARREEGVLFWGAFSGGEMLGGHIDLYFGGTAQAWQAGISPRSHEMGISSYLVYNAAREACARGASAFNLGSSGGDEGMIFFKESMGGKKVLYPVIETRKLWWKPLRRK